MPYSTPKGTNDSVSTEENTKLRALYQNRNLAINAPTKRSELEKLFSIICLNYSKSAQSGRFRLEPLKAIKLSQGIKQP